MNRNRSVSRFVAAAVVCMGTLMMVNPAHAQLDDVLEKVRHGVDRVNADNPTYYLKSARAVEPNVCLYSNGDPTGVLGPLVFRSSYVATPNCRNFSSCSEVKLPPDEPRPPDCGAEVPDSRFWRSDEKPLNMRSDGTASVDLTNEEYVRVRTCMPVETPILACTTGGVRLFRAEVEYDYPEDYQGRHDWDRYQNLAGRMTETKTQRSWKIVEESRKTGNQKTTTLRFAGLSSGQVPAHNVSATVSQSGDQQATVHFEEANPDVTHYATLRNSFGNVQEWNIATEINRRSSPPVSRVSFIPASYTVSIEDKSLPDLLGLPGADGMQTSYLITVYTEKKHRDETQIFQTEAENPGNTVLFALRMDREALLAMKGKKKKIRIHVRAQRSDNPWVDATVSPELVYETKEKVKFPKK